VVREELLENPVLEDSVEIAAEQQKPSSASEASSAAAAPEAEAERIGETEIPVARVSEDKLDTTTEIKPDSRSGMRRGFRLGHLSGVPVECPAYANLPAEHRGSALLGSHPD